MRRARPRTLFGRTLPKGPASLGAKLVLILTAVGVAGALGITLLLASVITPSFSALETRAIDGHVERTRAALAEQRFIMPPEADEAHDAPTAGTGTNG